MGLNYKLFQQKEALKLELLSLNRLLEELEAKEVPEKKKLELEKEKELLKAKKTQFEDRYSKLSQLELVIRASLRRTKRRKKKESEK